MRRLRPAFALAAAAASSLTAAGLLLARRLYRVEVAGPSMLPSLHPGDYLVVRRGAPPRGDAAFGRIVATRDEVGRLLLKRIVGLPGESLRVGRAVQVNGRALIEPYTTGASGPADYRGVNRLGDDEYFLLDGSGRSWELPDLGLPIKVLSGAVWFSGMTPDGPPEAVPITEIRAKSLGKRSGEASE